MYHYLVCLQLGIVWVVLSGVRRLDEMTVTTGLGSESRLAVLAGRIRSEILSQPATPRQDKESLVPLRPLRPASLPWGGVGWADAKLAEWAGVYYPRGQNGLIGFLRNGHALAAPVLETGKQPTVHEKLCIITSPFIQTFILVFHRILAL